MKIVIFLIILALVVSAVMWRTRKADAERDLARKKAMKRKQEQRKVAITPEDHVAWPVAILPTGKPKGETAEEEAQPEPTMSSIEFEPVDHPSLQN